MPPDNDGAHAPGAGGQPPAGGTGAAGTPPSVDALVQSILGNAAFQTALTGAAVGHAKRIEDRLSKQLEDLAGRLPAAPTGAGKSPPSDDKSDLAAQLKAAQDQAAKFQQRYLTERKQTALSSALVKHGCRPEGVEHALQLLMARGDIREVQGPDGQPQLVGAARVHGVDQDVPVDEAVRAWLTANPLFRPPAGAGGSGAAGGRAGTVGAAAGKSLDELSAEDVNAMTPEARKQLRSQLGLTVQAAGGFFKR